MWWRWGANRSYKRPEHNLFAGSGWDGFKLHGKHFFEQHFDVRAVSGFGRSVLCFFNDWHMEGHSCSVLKRQLHGDSFEFSVHGGTDGFGRSSPDHRVWHTDAKSEYRGEQCKFNRDDYRARLSLFCDRFADRDDQRRRCFALSVRIQRRLAPR